METATGKALADIAKQSLKVAALIHQPGYPVNQFQGTVRTEMPKHPPDKALQSIENSLMGIAREIHAYIRERVG